jgi:hypothetical protein
MTELEKIKTTLKQISQSKFEMLKFLSEYENKRLQRWENWLQMEILHELHTTGVEDLWFEDRYSQDKRVKVANEKADKYVSSIDVVYRRKRSSIASYNALELKVANNASTSIKGSLVDLDRIAAIPNSEWCFRSVYAIAAFKQDSEKKSKYLDFVRDFGQIESFGPYNIAILGWEAKNGDESSTRDYYKAWLKKLMAESKSFNIELARNKGSKAA